MAEEEKQSSIEVAEDARPDDVLTDRPPDWLDRTFFERAIALGLGEEEIKVAECEVQPATAKGENYASVVYKCTARTGKDSSDGEGKEYRTIIKCLPSNTMRQMFSNKAEIFRKERDIYTVILPSYEKILSKDGDRTSFPWPRYYCSNVDGKRDYIVLEDLGTHGFVMGQRMKGLDADHLELVLRALGEYHACSVAFELTSPEKFQLEVVEPFRDLIYTPDNEDMMKWIQRSVEAVASLVSAWHGERYQVIGKRIGEWAPTINADVIQLLTQPAKGSVLCHGDVWLNNMLFKYSEGKPVEIKLLDFQIGRYASPATDLIYFLVTSTSAVTRRQHWARLLEQVYLRNFWMTLEHLGLKDHIKGDLYSLKWFQQELKRHGSWGIFNATTILRGILLESKDVPDLDKMTEDDIKEEKDFFKSTDDRIYQERLQGLIDEYDEEGLFC